jgi:hypothetical protein
MRHLWAFLGMLMVQPAVAQTVPAPSDVYTSFDLSFEKGGSPFLHFLNQLPAKEVTTAVTAVCTYYTGNASGCALIAGLDQKLKQAALEKAGVRDSGNEHGGAVVLGPSSGLKICRAGINWPGGSISSHATFTGTIQNNTKQKDMRKIAYYISIRGGTQNDYVKFTVYLDLIPEAENRSECMHAGPVWECGEKTRGAAQGCFGDQPGAFGKK